METIWLDFDNTQSLRFTGELVARTDSFADPTFGRGHSSKTGRWTEWELYKSAAGNFICHQISRTIYPGERDRFSGKVCEALEEVTAFFGHCVLAKKLYAEAGIDDVMDVA